MNVKRSVSQLFSSRSFVIWAMLAVALFALVGCIPPTPTPAPIPPTATAIPATATLAPAPTSTTAPVVAPVDELKAQIEADLILDPEGFDSFQGVAITELTVPAGSPALWMAHTYGFRAYNDTDDVPHFVAIYTFTADGVWQVMGQVDLECPSFVMDEGVSQVNVAPQGVWVEIVAGTGAHSGCFDLLHFDGSTLSVAASNFNSSPGAGYVADLNGDGLAEVALDQTEPYVFCYACGVRLVDFTILHWTGTQLEPVNLTALPDSAPADVREANNQAVTLANGWLWADAQASIAQAATLAPDNSTVMWNKVVIDLLADARNSARNGAYPLLENLFYGDYGAVRDVMAGVGVDNLFGPDTPLIVGTQAENWLPELRTWIDLATAKALTADPELPMAIFVRGWVTIQSDPTDPSGPADIRRAAELAPNEPLFTDSAALLN